MLLGTSYAGGVSTIVLVYLFLHSLVGLAPFYLIIDIILFFLWIIALLGGLAVMIGGYLLTTSHIRLGKFIIAVAAGFGLISLILVILWVLLTYGWSGLVILTWLLMHTSWALGLILTIIARSTAH